MTGSAQHQKRNGRREGSGKGARWKSLKADFSTSLGNPAKKRGTPTFHTTSTTAGYSLVSGLNGSVPNRREWLSCSPASTASSPVDDAVGAIHLLDLREIEHHLDSVNTEIVNSPS